MTTISLPPPLTTAPSVPQLSALRDALVGMELHRVVAPSGSTVPTTGPPPLSDPSVLTALLAGLQALPTATAADRLVARSAPAPSAPAVTPVTLRPPSVAPLPVLPHVTSFSAGVDTPGFVDALVAFLRWLLGR